MDIVDDHVECSGTGSTQPSSVVVRYEERPCPYSQRPNARLWAVKTGGSTKAEGRGSLRIWIEPSFEYELRQQGSPAIASVPIDDNFSTRSGFCKGQPLVSLETTIPTCLGSSRPPKLWRVIHGGHSFPGTLARGSSSDNKIKTSPLNFQLQFQRHLNWNCRDPSPFMSSTNDHAKAIRICGCYEARGMTGITILEIDTTAGEEWDATGSHIWEVQELLRCFRLPILQRKKYLMNEYLIEKCIPSSRVTRRVDWDEEKAKLDPKGTVRSAARREFKQAASKKRKECDASEQSERNKRTRGYKCLKGA
ncbi:hypothetical protein VMCG_10759 [Cytospora schulzeri]|uniref:DUF7587 domain-containing protein n=1 Tax=Cytospora schulzeri TaxID=448051 RepID=A0A423V8R8_9PEZI|nr:hypothetical protein VMCG_10759 [Valsa malicola]